MSSIELDGIDTVSATPVLSMRGVHKDYTDDAGQVTSVLAGLDLDIAEGEFLAVLGFSGSGKSTLVGAMAGLVEPDAGEVSIDGEPAGPPGPERGVVFQSYSLMPWLSAYENVALGVDSVHADHPAAERRRMVEETLELVGLADASDRRPSELSGGMRQRVAVARALAMQPRILLMDEPLSALDALTRAKLQDEIERIRGVERRTIVLVTNDVDEALLLADRVAVLERGPGAGIGRVFDVDVARPRERTTINEDPAYQALRNEIIGYLSAMNDEHHAFTDVVGAALPDVTPVDLDAPTRSRRRAPVAPVAPADEQDPATQAANDAEADSLDPELPEAYVRAAHSPVTRRYLELFNVHKVYDTPSGPLTVLDGIDILMDKGEFISLIGHSGCGKSTALTMTAGLNDITKGGIVLDGREITGAGPDKAVVFQAPSLMPWLTVRDNVAMGVERVYPDATAQERRDIVDYYLDRVGLADAKDKRANELSNGMKQRVGLARAFALSPKLLLLDEPFGMLDSLTRWDLQDVLVEVWNRTKVTAICVTHDVDEAILLADRVVMMTNGPKAKIGEVLEVDLPRPRDRREVLKDPRFYDYRQRVLSFLERYEHGA